MAGGIIYCAGLIDGRKYYGKTTKSLHVRRNEHKGSVRRGSTRHFHSAIRLYRLENFYWTIVEKCSNEIDLATRETFWILYDNTIQNGFNEVMLSTGQAGYHLTDEHKRKISLGNKGKHSGPQTKEHREQISRSLKGRKRSVEHCLKLRLVNLGEKNPMFGKRYKMSDERREKIRQAALRQWARKNE